MTHPERSVEPAPMEGGGLYNRSSQVQANDLQRAIAELAQAALDTSLPASPAPILLVDYGASQGRNSLKPMKAAIDALRRRVAPERSICVVHTDLPGNDFATLFETLEHDPDSYLAGDPAVYASAVGRSFYRRLLPPASVSLGWSSWAVQWLSQAPAPIPDHVQVAYCGDGAVRAAFHRQAAQDWRSFLAARSFELRPGGRLVVLTMACSDAGEFGYRSLLTALVAELEEMVGAGLLQADEWARMGIPTVGRGRAEWLEPFGSDGRFEDLEIEKIEVFEGHDSFWTQMHSPADALAFATKWAAFSRASVFRTLAGALDADADADADAQRRLQFMDRLESGLVRRLAAAPERMQIPLALLRISKRG